MRVLWLFGLELDDYGDAAADVVLDRAVEWRVTMAVGWNVGRFIEPIHTANAPSSLKAKMNGWKISKRRHIVLLCAADTDGEAFSVKEHTTELFGSMQYIKLDSTGAELLFYLLERCGTTMRPNKEWMIKNKKRKCDNRHDIIIMCFCDSSPHPLTFLLSRDCEQHH